MLPFVLTRTNLLAKKIIVKTVYAQLLLLQKKTWRLNLRNLVYSALKEEKLKKLLHWGKKLKLIHFAVITFIFTKIIKSLNKFIKKCIIIFTAGFDHKLRPTSIDLNTVRICFQAFYYSSKTEKFTNYISPVVSDPIYDKSMHKLINFVFLIFKILKV